MNFYEIIYHIVIFAYIYTYIIIYLQEKQEKKKLNDIIYNSTYHDYLSYNKYYNN